jgi:hypothetical protein
MTQKTNDGTFRSHVHLELAIQAKAIVDLSKPVSESTL